MMFPVPSIVLSFSASPAGRIFHLSISVVLPKQEEHCSLAGATLRLHHLTLLWGQSRTPKHQPATDAGWKLDVVLLNLPELLTVLRRLWRQVQSVSKLKLVDRLVDGCFLLCVQQGHFLVVQLDALAPFLVVLRLVGEDWDEVILGRSGVGR